MDAQLLTELCEHANDIKVPVEIKANAEDIAEYPDCAPILKRFGVNTPENSVNTDHGVRGVYVVYPGGTKPRQMATMSVRGVIRARIDGIDSIIGTRKGYMKFGFAGGVVDLGEKPIDAIRRELVEEIDIDIVVLDEPYTYLDADKYGSDPPDVCQAFIGVVKKDISHRSFRQGHEYDDTVIVPVSHIRDVIAVVTPDNAKKNIQVEDGIWELWDSQVEILTWAIKMFDNMEF
jgi:8-oxo-dGTP pyrophosphatase MutT (NUDIX family)